ncbi:2-(3-amino-3-carboxypropyl)histidine synthase subunit 1 [Macadamia integrifolia]|uniref:2-(3-amino-3-carboxypropyl)histidine synthase subunit 1 n=1 Tax=Macadamia integrifolia TaxID=60698 RepID=UPI001C4EB5E9|nr:2-(3-amino-3-carboxypropyl)histidine synthase subunit 1 [Macadamia integrifolia]
MEDSTLLPSQDPKPRRIPKRFIKNQIPDSITNNPSLNAAISLLPSNYSFEVHKCVWRIVSSGAKRVALQFPEGLLMYSLVLSDIFKTFANVDDCFVLGDVTYGACCVDDFSATALNADLLIHYGHSCLIPIDATKVPSLYVFVEIKIDVDRLVETVRLNIDSAETKKIALAGTIQFAAAIRAAKPSLESVGFEVLVPQLKPLSAGEVLGCTAPTMRSGSVDMVVFVADGRFHLEAFMIANPAIKAFRYDPYLGVLFLEEYDHVGMKDVRKKAILRSREARNWGIVLGTLGRQGNTRILERLQKRMTEKGFDWTVMLISELSPARIALFGESVDAWIQIACPRLSIDWGEAFEKPLLTPFEAEISLGFIPGWWERTSVDLKSSLNGSDGLQCENNESCCGYNNGEVKTTADGATDYPMDYYAQDGGEWNCSYSKKSSHPSRRNLRSCCGNGDTSCNRKN